MNELRRFTKSRDKAFIAFVLHDDWDAVLRHMAQYGQSVPKWMPTKCAQAGVYKAVQEIASIPNEVKAIAAQKCIELGFRPTT